MTAAAKLTKAESELVGKVRKGHHEPSDKVELVALHALARLGHLHFTHDDDGFHFTAPPAKSRKRKG